jgi:DNA-binding XRE family transcriptional regulator
MKKKKSETNRYADLAEEIRAWKEGSLRLRVSMLNDDRKSRTVWEESGPEQKLRYERQARFKTIRAELGLSQAGMAKALRVATKTLQGWEIGKPIPNLAFMVVEMLHDMPAVRKRLLAA